MITYYIVGGSCWVACRKELGSGAGRRARPLEAARHDWSPSHGEAERRVERERALELVGRRV